VQASAATTAAGLDRGVLGPFPWPLYFIGTRDCFTYNLVQRHELARLCSVFQLNVNQIC
jgi:hypothetical protein